MKKFLSFVVTLTVASFVLGQTAEKTIGAYKKDLEKASRNFKEVNNPDAFQNYQFKNKKTGEVTNFEDLSKFDQRMFFFFQKLKLEDNLKNLQNSWVVNYKNLNTNPDKGKANDPDTTPAKAIHVSNALDKLFELRKQMAVETEKTMEKIFKDFPDKLERKEMEFSLKQLKEWHDHEELISR